MNTTFLRRLKPIVFSIFFLIIIFSLLYTWRITRSGNIKQSAMLPIAVSAVRAEPRHFTEMLQALGTLQAVREVVLAPDTPGRVTAIHFKSGQLVEEGDVLAQLYDAPLQADYAVAEAKAHLAQLKLQHSQKLASTDAEPRERLQEHKSEAAQAMAEIKRLDAQIQQKTIRAPFSGQVGIRHINLGQYLSAGDTIATLTQLDQLYVNFTLPQQKLATTLLGTEVQVTTDATPNQIFSAKISTIEPQINRETRNVSIQALLSNTNKHLKSGMYASVQLPLSETDKAIMLPLTAIVTSASGDSVVLVQDADSNGVGKAVAVPVTIGHQLGENILVTQGVKAGDIVVSAGQNRLPPNASVKFNIQALPTTQNPAIMPIKTTAINAD